MQKSFTLIELITAIFLITLGAGAAVNVIQNTISFTVITSSQLTASYLAQEGIEIIRNQRDSNWLAQRGSPAITWDSNIQTGVNYSLDYQSQSFPDISCSLGADGYLKYNNGFYDCHTGEDTKFKRKITITKPEIGKMVVSVEVSWSERGRDHQVMAQTILHNWK